MNRFDQYIVDKVRHLRYQKNPGEDVDIDAALASPEGDFECPWCKDIVSQKTGIVEAFGPVCCDACVEKKIKDDRMAKLKGHWEKQCPSDIRDTDTSFEDFNKLAYKRVMEFPMTTSFMLLGETGSCKTRIACHRAKMALISGMSIRLLWPDELKDQPRFISRREHLAELCSQDFMVLDDALLAGASKEHTADFLKDLIDKRIREQKTTIITSQITGDEFYKDGAKFGSMTDAEGKRIEAIVRRIREKFQVVNCEAFKNGETEPEELF